MIWRRQIRQWNDVLGIARTHGGGLEREYLVRGSELAVEDLLDSALAEPYWETS